MTRRRTPAVAHLVAVPHAGAVYWYDGNNMDATDTPRPFPDSRIWTRDVAGVVRTAARRPLESWRYWHRRGTLIRASQAPRSVMRDFGGLYDVDLSPQLSAIEREVTRPWDALAIIGEWCEARGMRRHNSAGAIGVDLLNQEAFRPNFPPLWAHLEDEEAIRPAVYGGRAEVFDDELDRGHYNGTVIYYDCNGAYLDVMRSCELPYPYRYLPFPNLRAEGVTDATIVENQAGFPVLPVRDAAGYPGGRKRGTWTNREIRYALECGAQLVKIHGGLHYPARTRALQRLGAWLAEQREAEKRPAIRGMLKKIPNALIGRFASPPTVCVTRTGIEWQTREPALTGLKVDGDVWSVELPLRRRSPWYAVAWSAAILAEQRIRLHQQMTSHQNNGLRVLYVDTDGIMLGVGREEVPPISLRVGEFKIEWIGQSVHIRGVKSYLARKADGRTIERHAGKPLPTLMRLQLE